VLPSLALTSLLLAIVVIDLVRRRRLREEYSWLWVAGAAGALVLSVEPRTRGLLARALGTDDGGAVLAAGMLFLVAITLDLSTQVSRQANHVKNLAQDLARLEKRLADVQSDRDGAA
jgi:hypothetical protein